MSQVAKIAVPRATGCRPLGSLHGTRSYRREHRPEGREPLLPCAVRVCHAWEMGWLDRQWGRCWTISVSFGGRARTAFVAVLLSGCVWSDDDVETESATTDPPECTTVCEVGVCQVLECDEDNVCVAEDRPAGSMDDDINGDCRGLICDGEGSWDVVITNDPPLDQRGDCMMPVCDDAGGVVLVLDQPSLRRAALGGRIRDVCV